MTQPQTEQQIEQHATQHVEPQMQPSAETKRKESTIIYPGSFAPPTWGHFDVVLRAAKHFDKVIWAIGVNRSKPQRFDHDEQRQMMQKYIEWAGLTNVEVDFFEGGTIRYAERKSAQFMLRGIRNNTDLQFELDLATGNRDILEDIETICLFSKPHQRTLSSSFVRELVSIRERIDQYVLPSLAPKIAEKLGNGWVYPFEVPDPDSRQFPNTLGQEKVVVYPEIYTQKFSDLFSPPTREHGDFIYRAAQKFDKVYWVVSSEAKDSPFTSEERMLMMQAYVDHYNLSNVIIDSYSNAPARYVVDKNAQFMLRGLNNTSDLPFELRMATATWGVSNDIETICMFAKPRYETVGSTLVNDLAIWGERIWQYLIPPVEEMVKAKLSKKP